MKVTIDLGKLLEFNDRYGKKYGIGCGDGFRAFILDFLVRTEDEKKGTMITSRRHYIFPTSSSKLALKQSLSSVR